MRALAILREAIATARSQPVASVLTVLVISGMVLAVMLTTGRTVGAEQQVLGSLDEMGTRSIVIRAESGAGVTNRVLDRIDVVDGIEWAAAFTSTTDATRRAARRRRRAGPSSTTRSATTSTSASSRSTSSSGRVAGARGDAQGTSNSIDTISHGTPTWSTVTAPGRQPEENERSESGRKVGGF